MDRLSEVLRHTVLVSRPRWRSASSKACGECVLAWRCVPSPLAQRLVELPEVDLTRVVGVELHEELLDLRGRHIEPQPLHGNVELVEADHAVLHLLRRPLGILERQPRAPHELVGVARLVRPGLRPRPILASHLGDGLDVERHRIARSLGQRRGRARPHRSARRHGGGHGAVLARVYSHGVAVGGSERHGDRVIEA
eukprot:scaffold44473_cov66-Phaeocystis_antarctica.AAC.1